MEVHRNASQTPKKAGHKLKLHNVTSNDLFTHIFGSIACDIFQFLAFLCYKNINIIKWMWHEMHFSKIYCKSFKKIFIYCYSFIFIDSTESIGIPFIIVLFIFLWCIMNRILDNITSRHQSLSLSSLDKTFKSRSNNKIAWWYNHRNLSLKSNTFSDTSDAWWYLHLKLFYCDAFDW